MPSEPNGFLICPHAADEQSDAPQPAFPQSPSTKAVKSCCSPWLAAIVYPLARYLVLPLYFRRIEVVGRENFPVRGPVIVAPTHRSRWDALIVPYTVGQDVTGRTLRFMVSADEVKGVQGWFIRRLGGFAINTRRPGIATLRHSINLLERGETLVIFPEGDIFRYSVPLKPGLARIALQAEGSQPNLGLQIVPIHIQYSKPLVPWRCTVKVQVGQPIQVADYCPETPKLSAKRITAELEQRLNDLSGLIRQKVC